MSFLVADWQKLIFVNYEVDPSILLPYLPKGLELDGYKGKYYISFVTMRFNNTRVLGIPFPFHTRFEEVNLRFYVKRKLLDNSWRKGVIFISEIVPKPMITWIAKALYNESYQTLKLDHRWDIQRNTQTINYNIFKQGHKNSISIKTNHNNEMIAHNSLKKFIIERYFGYTSNRKNRVIEYEVIHTPWKTSDIHNQDININFEQLYGKTFSFLNTQPPESIYFTEGSKTTVGNKIVL